MRIVGPSLRAKLVLLVAGASLAPAALVGVAFYMTGQRMQADEIAQRLSERATSAELFVSRFLESRGSADREPLWSDLAAAYDDVSVRLRIVDGRRRTLFDSAAYPREPPHALPPAVADRLLDLRIGTTSYADEAGVKVIAVHRFMPSLDFGTLIELPAERASATSRRLLDPALRGSLATVALLAALSSILALYLTRPLRSLVGGLEQAAATGEVTRLDDRRPREERVDGGLGRARPSRR